MSWPGLSWTLKGRFGLYLFWSVKRGSVPYSGVVMAAGITKNTQGEGRGGRGSKGRPRALAVPLLQGICSSGPATEDLHSVFLRK